MNFSTKNFSYVTKSFGEFLDQIDHGRKLYLRSLSSERPSELPADISRDFPSIAADFQVPVELSAAMENTHSSPLRISGPVTMWLHYDVSMPSQLIAQSINLSSGNGQYTLPNSGL
jgi:tRNA wybutosine-synthesizing protein 4